MFKKLHLLLLLLNCTCAIATAQISTKDVVQLPNAAIYSGSQDDLIKTLATSIRFPALSYRASRVGTVVGVIKFSRSGDIVEIGTLNKAFPEFKKEFERVVPLIKGKWTATNDTAQFFYAVIPVQFRVIGVGYTLNSDLKPAYFQETIVTSASGVSSRKEAMALEQKSAGVYQQVENDLVVQVNTYVEQENFEEAIKTLEELVNLQPLHTAYYQPLISLHERVGNEQEAAYYREVVRLFAK